MDDVSPYDEDGNKMDVLPFGDLKIGPYTVSMNIKIDDIANRIPGRFHPMNHRQNVIDEAGKMGYTMFLDPLPGYWDTQMFNAVQNLIPKSTLFSFSEGMTVVLVFDTDGPQTSNLKINENSQTVTLSRVRMREAR